MMNSSYMVIDGFFVSKINLIFIDLLLFKFCKFLKPLKKIR